IEVVWGRVGINSQVLDKDEWWVCRFRLDGGVKGLAHLAKPRVYRSILVEKQDGARQRLRSRRDRHQGHGETESDTHDDAARHTRERSLHGQHLCILRLARDDAAGWNAWKVAIRF